MYDVFIQSEQLSSLAKRITWLLYLRKYSLEPSLTKQITSFGPANLGLISEWIDWEIGWLFQ